MNDTCQVLVNRGGARWDSFEKCGRPVERGGKCKIHLRVDERREAKRLAWEEKQERGNALCAEAESLSESLGTDVSAHYNWNKGEYDGKFVVGGDWLRSLGED